MISAFVDNWIVSTIEGMGSRSISKPGLLSVDLNYSGGVSLPIVRGMPFVTFNYDARTPTLTTIHAILSVNGGPLGEITGSKFSVELNSGQTWMIYTSSDVTIQVSGKQAYLSSTSNKIQRIITLGSSITFTSSFTGTLRIGVLLDGASESDFDLFSSRIPTGGSVSAESNGNSATYTFQWETTGSGELLMLALPHHIDTLSGVQVIYFP